ncbi:unnamed protein product [Symbiodinium necroappetens]|uniref:Uncharacterized protein n=1 Tax=Symbiodinium necroappetens TaxID=1628268 RepID=A0A812MHA2_9DINO|nr:unnamed protein product [Symbiodinium necroappetens]
MPPCHRCSVLFIPFLWCTPVEHHLVHFDQDLVGSFTSIPAHRIEASVQWMLTRYKEIHNDQDDMVFTVFPKVKDVLFRIVGTRNEHFVDELFTFDWATFCHFACSRYKLRSLRECNRFFSKFVAAPLAIRLHWYLQTLQSVSSNNNGGFAINMSSNLIVISFPYSGMLTTGPAEVTAATAEVTAAMCAALATIVIAAPVEMSDRVEGNWSVSSGADVSERFMKPRVIGATAELLTEHQGTAHADQVPVEQAPHEKTAVIEAEEETTTSATEATTTGMQTVAPGEMTGGTTTVIALGSMAEGPVDATAVTGEATVAMTVGLVTTVIVALDGPSDQVEGLAATGAEIGSVRSVAATILRAEMSASSAAQRSHPDELSLRATRPHVDAPAAGMQSKRRCLVHLNTAFASSLAFGCGA